MNIKITKYDDRYYDELIKTIEVMMKETYLGIVENNYFDVFNDNNFKKNYKIKLNDYNNYYVVFDNDKIIGILNYMKSNRTDLAEHGYLSQIYLLKDYQRKGIGKILFIKCLEGLINEGYKDMYLTTVKGTNALDFYKHLGGEVIGEYKESVLNFYVDNYVVEFKNIENILNNLNG